MALYTPEKCPICKQVPIVDTRYYVAEYGLVCWNCFTGNAKG